MVRIGLDPTLVVAGLEAILIEALGDVRINGELRHLGHIKTIEIIEKEQDKMKSQSILLWSY